MLEREPLQRLVLHTDGTMTDLIELLVGEPIEMRKLAQRFAGVLGIDPELPIHVRCYRTFVGGRPLAVIREALAPVLWAWALAPGAACR